MNSSEKNKDKMIEKTLEIKGSLEAEGFSPNECAPHRHSSGLCPCGVFSSALDAMFIIDLEGNYLDVNDAGCAMFGYAKEEILGSNIGLLLFPEEVEKAFEEGKKITRSGAYFPGYRMRKKDGGEMWVAMSVVPIKLSGKDCLLGVKRDVTAERQTAIALERERDLANKYLDVAGVIIVVLNADRKVALINRRGCEVLGRAEQELVGSDWFDNFICENDREATAAAFKDLMSGNGAHAEYYENQVVTKALGTRTIAWRNTVLRDENGKIYATLSSGEDITERILSEKALLKAREELEARVAERTDDLKRANAALELEIRERQRAESVLHAMLEGTSSVAGEEFLRSLVRSLALALKCRYVFVGELAQNGKSVRSLAMWANGGFISDFEYELKDTPCEQVAGKEICVYSERVAKAFPKDLILTEMGVESYIGVPLYDADKKPTGILVGLDDKPMEESKVKAVFAVFAQRASLEMARQKAEDERKKSEELLTSFINNATAVIFMKDAEGRYMLTNGWYEKIFGIKTEDLIGKTSYDIFPREVADRLRENDIKVAAGGVPVTMEEEIVEPDGLVHTFVTVKFPIPGFPGAVCGIATDITGRKRAEDELNRVAGRLKEAQQIARIGNWDWDIVNNTLFWSDEIYRIFGLKPAEFGATYEAFMNSVHPEDRDSVMNAVNEALVGAAPYSIDHRIVLPGGAVRIVRERGRVVSGDGGDPVRMAGTVQDITEQRLAEEELRASEQKFRNLTENIPMGIAITSDDGVILESNPALWKVFGCGSREEFQGHNVQDFFADPADRMVLAQLVREHGLIKDMEVRLKRRDSTEFSGSLTALSQVKDGQMRYISIFQDITERKKTEAEMLKAQKLESIGALAGGIAHDFNNILLGVLGNVTIAKNYVAEGDKVFALLTEVEKAADRAKSLTRQLLTFSRGGEPVKEVAPMASLVKDSAALVLRDSAVSASFDIPPDVRMVEMDEGQMSQVINNIVLNAEQAMQGTGVIEMSLKNVTVTPEDGLPAASGEFVVITVKDSGPGIPKKIINRIFDPFFTTKQKASGLGLAVSYSIVKKHNGFILASSSEGSGSVFEVYLPAAEQAAEPDRDAVSMRDAANSTGTVLVMDDEDIVRDVSGEMLGMLGCKAVFASDGEQALELYRKALKQGRPFDAVILDLTIPGGMGGVETVKRLLDIDPDVKAIVSSGYSKDPIMSEFRKYGFSGVIAKPYRVMDFSKAVKAVLDA